MPFVLEEAVDRRPGRAPPATGCGPPGPSGRGRRARSRPARRPAAARSRRSPTAASSRGRRRSSRSGRSLRPYCITSTHCLAITSVMTSASTSETTDRIDGDEVARRDGRELVRRVGQVGDERLLAPSPPRRTRRRCRRPCRRTSPGPGASHGATPEIENAATQRSPSTAAQASACGPPPDAAPGDAALQAERVEDHLDVDARRRRRCARACGPSRRSRARSKPITRRPRSAADGALALAAPAPAAGEPWWTTIGKPSGAPAWCTTSVRPSGVEIDDGEVCVSAIAKRL